jgi:chitin disaccharide deacetylase
VVGRAASTPLHGGRLIVNADDWGRSRETTDRILECWERRRVSSVSAMVFMKDSERAASIACERGIDAGLHLNFTTPFSGQDYPARLQQHLQEVARRLLRHRLAPVMFYPELISSFQYVVWAQFDEFSRLYGGPPQRLDGHHHMHLCSNVALGGLLQAGTVVRRNFSFEPGEKSFANRVYRRVIDRLLARRHLLTDFFFSLTPLAPVERLDRIISLSRRFVVEVETHPVNPEEYRFLSGGEMLCQVPGSEVASSFTASIHGN